MAQNGQQQVTVTQATGWKGPLPHPDALQKFEDICPGAADRIITLAEGEAAHRRGVEKDVVRIEGRNLMLGKVFGFTFLMTVAIGGIVLVALGNDVHGFYLLVGSAGIAALQAIWGKNPIKKKE